MRKSIYRNGGIPKLTFSAMLAALYFVLCLFEGPLASGYMVNVRLAEGLCVFALFIPEVIAGASIGCFLYNLFFGLGIIDASIGTVATILGTSFIYFIGRFFKSNKVLQLVLFGLGSAVANGLLVPIVLILCLPDTLTWAEYGIEFLIVSSGEAVAVYGVGIPLYLATFRWLPRLINPQQGNDKKDETTNPNSNTDSQTNTNQGEN